MSASTDPPADAELERLLDEYGQAEYEWGQTSRNPNTPAGRRQYDATMKALRAITEHIAEHYVRRDAYTAARGILPWREGDELPEERIRRLRDGTD